MNGRSALGIHHIWRSKTVDSAKKDVSIVVAEGRNLTYKWEYSLNSKDWIKGGDSINESPPFVYIGKIYLNRGIKLFSILFSAFSGLKSTCLCFIL